ncbi:response regulator [Aquimarina brevivitae]|uniref:DNA-binding NarL/FixJ family response regulator n=1 Tax=Aquimarina brevivitae TaxID=323412 RepID=A0A4Q7P120_9FLAO|nr:response regulator [Aquimarina brevivitae]RZS93511.1 DNA-binding NarL/FixJ family response regulator [Aquimarina brevivitae]
MKKKLKVLMIDDHPMIIEGYKNTLLGENQNEYQIKIDIASNCDEAYDLILSSAKGNAYDMLFIDIKLPPSSDGTITSGEDLAKHAKELLPKAKIIILTMHREDHRIHNILKNINPSGFLIKSDLTSSELLQAFNNIVNGTPYYSATVNNHFRKMMNNNFSLDEKNLKILYHLSRGVKTKNLPNFVSLSLSAIEKRKNQIKEMFSIPKADDQKLLEEARKRGFV